MRRWGLLLLIASYAMALNYGDNGLGYPRMNAFVKGYYEFNYSQAYFNINNAFRLKDCTQFRYQLDDRLLLSFEKKFISNKLALGAQTQFNTGMWLGDIGVGIRNLGMAASDTNSPFGQEYVTWLYDVSKVKFTLGLQRMIGNGSEYVDPFLSARSYFLQHYEMDVFYENKSIGINLSIPLTDQLKLSLLAMAPAPNQDAGDFRNAAISFTWFTQPNSIAARGETVSMDTVSSVQTNDLDQKLNLLQARLSSLESLNSLAFQKKLMDELISQRLLDRKLGEEETDRLKLTLQHIQKGTDAYYAHDYQRALDEYNQANAIYPNLPLVHASLGSLQYVLGHFETAKQEWLLWLSLAPDSSEAKASLRKLQKEHPELFIIGGIDKE